MTKFCARNVRMYRPTTRTEQMLAVASKGVSSTGFCSGAVSGSGGILGEVFVLVILSLIAQMAGSLRMGLPAGLMDYAKDTLPARKPRESRREFPVVSESIIRNLLNIRGRRTSQREVNH